MARPLTTACKTALELLLGGNPRKEYDGDKQRTGEKDNEPCLARLWPDFEALSAEPEWGACSASLYGPLVQWLQTDVTILPLSGTPQKEAA